MVKMHSYVSSRGGETRELTYIPGPELGMFLWEYLSVENIIGALFPPELEAKHRLYPFLLPAYDYKPSEKADLRPPGFDYPPSARTES